MRTAETVQPTGEGEDDLSSRETEDAIADRIRNRRARTERSRKEAANTQAQEDREDESDDESGSPVRATGSRHTAGQKRAAAPPKTSRSRLRNNQETGMSETIKKLKGK